MPPKLALFLTLGFIFFLFWRDFREKPNVTGAIWVPILWVFLIVKPVSLWLHIFGFPGFVATSVEEGSPLDASVFLGVIALGIYILTKRRASLSEIVRNNPWMTAFVVYCFLAIFWADLPFVSFKRWIKVLGHPIMVLVLFTEPEPKEALLRLMKRFAYVLLPVSILWIKYFPHLGRDTSEWGGVENCGMMNSKNGLGGVSGLVALLFFWHCLQVLREEKSRSRRNELRLTAVLLLMTGYCLWQAHSATSWMALLLGALTMLFLGLRSVNKRLIGAYALAVILVLAVAQSLFDVYGIVVDLTGRESTIEGRGRLWSTLLETDTHPLFGAGFESYWIGERAEKIWAMPEFWWRPTQAHNGYLEIYLNLGIIGLVILIGLILATFWKIGHELLTDFAWGRLRLSFLVAIVAHNWTEAGFKGLAFSFFVFFIIAINYPVPRIAAGEELLEATTSEEETELVYNQEQA